ncbi:aldose epimerase family protein [Hymenobacter chitinivorans]|uniref:Aldose 1-epimerase n=1 Tax=Hymenobacter chitinivorans DSM 11115 TaxID=1121954 RepID=A0A2M9BLC2_9BACT|nr:aldose epimerase family protein [Hymenobacter chitinivorans]PJJ58757.1 aldose 1-epimerase [Hymenobacter chitinivorans DSM 11115]
MLLPNPTPLFSFRSALLSGSLLAALLTGCEQAKKPEQTAGSPGAASSTTTDSVKNMPTSASFGKTSDGTEVQLYTLTNAHGLKATISTYGGIVTSLLVPDKAGTLGDVVLGFDNVSGYQSPEYQKAGPYFGALIGRYGNRIAKGQFTLDGKQYTLAKNNGPNHLHGGLKGFDKVIWQAEPGTLARGQSLKLTYLSKDGEEGYPGNLRVTVTYTLTTTDELRIDYTATTDKATPVNLTNHSYFNLSAGQSKDVLSHQVTLPADRYTVVDAALIPTGELRAVKGTPFDFTTPHAIGERIAQVPGGYDHNWVLNDAGKLRPVALVSEPTSGRTLQVLTTEPGIQFYTGNFLAGTLTGKGGTVYGKHAGFCLETQHFPDSPNQPKFPSTTLQPGQTLQSTTIYKFGIQAANSEA